MAANSASTLEPAALAAALAQAAGSLLPWPPAQMAVALSGGADSLALALVAQTLARQWNIPLLALTVDHQLRRESGAEAEAVGQQMQRLGIPHRILHWNHAALEGNLHQAARHARYALLTEACRAASIPCLLLAHHADDQAETLLHQLMRGSGVDGLSAMPPARWENEVLLLRPLLTFPKSMLEATCRAAGEAWAEDPSNDDPRFARTLLRRMLTEFSAQGLSAARLAETAAHMARARAALEAATEALLQTGTCSESRATLPLPAWKHAPEEIRLRALRALATRLGAAEPPRFEALARLAAALAEAPSGKRSLHGLLWVWEAERLTLTPERP